MVYTPRKLTDEQIAQVLDLREQGRTYDRIAQDMGGVISPKTVAYHCTKAGVESPNNNWGLGPRGALVLQTKTGKEVRRFTPNEDAEIRRLDHEGKSAWAIARITGRPYSSIRNRLFSLTRHDARAEQQDMEGQHT